MDRFKTTSSLRQLLRIHFPHKRHALTNSSFKNFSRELIQQIADNLDVASAALFSISCKTIYVIIGSQYISNLTRHENLLFRRILAYDIKNMTLNGCCDITCSLQCSSPAKGVGKVLQKLSNFSVNHRKRLSRSYHMNEMAAAYLARDLHYYICFFAPYNRVGFPWTVEREVFWNIIREDSESCGFQKDRVTFITQRGSTLVRQHRAFQGKCGEVIRLRVDICAHLQCYSNSMHIRPRICPTRRDLVIDISDNIPKSSWGLYWKKVEEETSEIEHCVECQTEFSIRFAHVRDCIPNLHCRMELTITTWKELGRKLDDKIWREHFPGPQKGVPIPVPRVQAPRKRIADAFTPLAVLNLLPFV
ncbi:hypothetical protein EAF00_008066 [Botryotinia globosa]|nr:hypothetical protein EAF00_008066 [Botryotinia globosa]